MTKLDWHIGNVSESNDALVTGAVKDASSVVERTASQLMNTVSPSALAAFDNTTTLVRKPINTIGTAANYGKLAKTIPAVPMDIGMKALRFIPSRIDDILNYGINNNIERGVTAVKGFTTGFLANLISNNHQSRFKALNALATGIEGTGDIIGTAIKAIPGLAGKLTGIVDKYMAMGTTWTENLVKSVRITDKNFVGVNPIENSADTPEVANDNRAPSTMVAANDNHKEHKVAA